MTKRTTEDQATQLSSHIYSEILSDILSDISDILSDFLSDILSSILFDIWSDRLSGMHWGILLSEVPNMTCYMTYELDAGAEAGVFVITCPSRHVRVGCFVNI